jgi:predicted permease
MRWITSLRLRVRSLVQGRQVDRELDEELQYHFDHLVDGFVASGASLEEARYAAQREMGAIEQRKEECRDARGVNLIEHLRQDVASALRGLRNSPAFAFVAIVSLALGIGGNTAIFSLWNGLLHSPLPSVRNPQELVILSNPAESGSWTGRVNGIRSWLTYGEFEQLRDQAASFSAVMATQSSLNEFQARVDRGGEHLVKGRLVSAAFFETLGATPAIGRFFGIDDDGADSRSVVISHAYWQRLGGQTDLLGKSLFIRGTPLTIMGIAQRGFIGETQGQHPDLWAPLRLQLALLPGRDRLHDAAPDKSMWLHAFGRLQPGVTVRQAEAEANAIFAAGLEAFYGARASGPQRADYLDQHLLVQSAARGASSYRVAFSQSLTALLVGVGVLLIVACANLANLLLARGAARSSEMALRWSLGASRGRLIQQVMTENLVLAVMAGAVGVFVASVAHAALMQLMAKSDLDFAMALTMEGPTLLFIAGATLATAVIVGGLPAWQITRYDVAPNLKEHSRGLVARKTQRSGRILVSLQLALSLPLLVAAGLLVRTVDNLQRADLGFPAQQLLLVRVDLQEFATTSAERGALLTELRSDLQRVPGVRSVSYSQLGIFSGGRSSSSVTVEGYTPTGANDGESAMDVAGPEYFTTLGVPIVLGRDVEAGDRESTLNPVVINEAFAKQFFSGRNPIGMHINMPNNGNPVSHQVVGIAGNARTQDLRGDISPRFYLPVRDSASSSNSPTFLIRTSGDAAGLMATVRRAVQARRALPILHSNTIEEQMAPLVAQDRATAQLALVFGGAALSLAAMGLYGLLSYGVAHRTSEIAVRIALGARAGGVVAMILRETVVLVGAGLIVGGGLAYGASRLIASRLYGVQPQDPVTLAVATGLLLAVALTAAYLPARRAAGLDPMRALRQS